MRSRDRLDRPLAIQRGKVVAHYEELPTIQSHKPFKHVVLSDEKRFISSTAMPETTSVSSLVT